jgi:hypothetical protein
MRRPPAPRLHCRSGHVYSEVGWRTVNRADGRQWRSCAKCWKESRRKYNAATERLEQIMSGELKPYAPDPENEFVKLFRAEAAKRGIALRSAA